VQKTLDIVERYSGFVFASFGLHPQAVDEWSEKVVEEWIETVKKNRDKVVSVGEIGLDYHWVKDKRLRLKQQELFARLIEFAKEIKKPITVHSWDATDDTVKILDDAGWKTHWHMLNDRKALPTVLENGWMVSVNALILRSKDVRKIARDVPMDRLMLETDSPWLSPEKLTEKEGTGEGEKVPDSYRNEPSSIRVVAERIAGIKKLLFDDVWRTCGRNAAGFFGLPVKI